MRGGRSGRAGALALAALAGCGDGGEGPPPGPADAVLVLPVDDAPAAAFYDLPYPNDLRRTAGGIDLADHPRPNALIGEYLDAIAAEQDGFGRASAIYLRFDGTVDPASLPATPADAQADDAAIYLVDVDPTSPRRGERIAVDVRLITESLEVIDAPFVVVQPTPGVLLAERTTYAVVATGRLRATDGDAVAAGTDVAALLGDGAAPAPVAAARAAYAPLRAWLDEPGGDERADVVSATVFTTQDTTSLMASLRDAVERDVAPPTVRELRRRGARDGFTWFDGIYDAPNFQTGEAPYQSADDGGGIALDPETGAPVVVRTEALRVSITVPDGPRPADGWPIVLYAHGTGGDYHSFVDDGTAGRLAAAGLACASIDQVLHGPRNEVLAPEVAFYNLQNPYAARDNTLQGAVDDVQLLRLVIGFRHTERHPGGRTIAFDPDEIYFFGHSQGSTTGIPFVAVEPRVRAAVFSGAGGLLYQALLHKTEPLDIPGLLQLFIRDAPIDRFHPIINLLQAYIERADSAAYARRLADRDPRPSLFVSEGLVDRYAPVESLEALAVALGPDLVAPERRPIPWLAEVGGAIVPPPIVGNRGDATWVVAQYDEALDSDGHFVVFDVPAAERQTIEFLRTMAADGQATVVVP
jgi:hypothetical protein